MRVRACVCVHFQQKQYIITSEWLTYWLEILREIFPEASFIPKWECKQSNRKDSESTQPPTHTHTSTHTLVVKGIVPAESLVIFPVAWRGKREEEKIGVKYKCRVKQCRVISLFPSYTLFVQQQ